MAMGSAEMHENGPTDAARDTERAIMNAAVRLSFLGLFAWWAFAIVAPFLGVVLWAIILAVALYPTQARVARVLGGRPRVASLLVTLALLALIVGPAAMLAESVLVDVVGLQARLAREQFLAPAELDRLRALPLVGSHVDAAIAYATGNLRQLLSNYAATLVGLGQVALGHVASAAFGLVTFAAAIVISGFLYVYGPDLAAGGRRLVARIAGPRGDGFVDLAAQTVRSVARGVIGVAIVQAMLLGLGLAVAGVPGAGLLTLLGLLLAIVQLGVVVPAAIALVWSWLVQDAQTALLLTLYLIPVGLSDNVMRPFFLGKGLRTPVLVVLVGLMGGVLAYGMVGVFVGPIVLAVLYELVVEWVRAGEGRASGGIE